MDYFIKIILPIYFIIYFGIAFVLKSLIVAKRIGKNPLVLPKDDSAYGLIGYYFKLTHAGASVPLVNPRWRERPAREHNLNHYLITKF